MSDRFRFRLGRLLTLREKAQDRAATALAQSLEAATRLEGERTRAAEIGTTARLQQLSDVGDAHRQGERAALQWLSECADLRVESLAKDLAEAEAEAERRRHELMVRTRERRVLEKLRGHVAACPDPDGRRRAAHHH